MPIQSWRSSRLLTAVLLAAALAALGLAAYLFTAPSPTPYQKLGADLGALRQRFNQDAGEARVLLLVSPT